MNKLLYIAIVLSFFTVDTFGFETRAGKISVQFTWGALYDSNLLRYSDRDRDNFLNETETHKSPIRSLDDLRTDYKISAELRNKFWQKRNTTLRATVDFAHHVMDPIKNLGWISLTGRQEISKRWIGSIGYFYEPRFYIRDYTDAHTGLRQNCEFALQQIKGDLTYRPKWLFDVTGSVKLKSYIYNEFFTEYDGDVLGLGLTAVYRPGKWRFSAGYSFETFDNTGFAASLNSSEDSSINDSEFGQGDYNEDIYAGSIRYSFIGLRREMSLQAGTEISKRAFLTERSVEIDPMHSGREDWVYEFSLTNQIALSKKIGMELGVASHVRNSEATKPNIGNIKDFDRFTTWVEFSYELE